MRRGKIFIISGPSGSGKTTLHKQLLLNRRFSKELVKSISATTRPKHPEEKNGRDYLFLKSPDFKEKIKKGYFLEWQKVFENYYGTPKIFVEKLLLRGKNVLLCIDVKGAQVVYRQFPDAVRIFIKAPTVAILKKRLEKRGTESKKDLIHRLAIAKKELRYAKKYQHVVVNDYLTHAVKSLESIIHRELNQQEEQ